MAHPANTADSEQPDVAVVDFAVVDKSDNDLPTGIIQPPQSKEEWDTFITRYALGEFDKCSFVIESNSPNVVSSSRTSTVPPPAAPHLASIISGESVPTSDTIVPERPSLIDTPYGSSGSSVEEAKAAYADVSGAGPSNQDPDIPNIAQEDLPTVSTSSKRVRKLKDEASSKQYKEQGTLSQENMRQLGVEQQEDRVKEREEARAGRSHEGGSMGRRGKRRERGHAELASVGGRSVSAGYSSPEDDPYISSRRKKPPRRPQSRGSGRSRQSKEYSGSTRRQGTGPSLDAALLDSATNDSTSASQVELNYDHTAERTRIREFFQQHRYMPAPRQTPDAIRRRLRVIRRLGLDNLDQYHKETLDRFTRLAVSIFGTRCALISIITKDRQIFLSEIGFGKQWTELDIGFCCHTIMTPGSGEQCMVVPDAAEDWRFKHNPLVQDGAGPVQFYAGAPLRVGHGSKAAIIGSMCILDDKPRQLDDAGRRLLADLADCVVSELELIYSQKASVESAKLHQISVDFLRRSLKHRPGERAGSRTSATGTGTGTQSGDTTSSASSTTGKRKEGSDEKQNQRNIDIYDEACREIRVALDAYAVAVVDLSQFHLFYPAYQNSSVGGGSSTRAGSTSGYGRSLGTGTTGTGYTGTTGGASSTVQPGTSSHVGEDEAEAYSKPANVKRARQTYAVTDPMAPSRTPQVLFIPSRRKSDPKGKFQLREQATSSSGQDDLAVLGYSCAHDGFAFNFTSSPAARKIISDFIASNVKTRRVWYARDENEGIAQSITHLMPPGTETSMAMPVFGFDGQVAFAVVACWTDPLYTYPAGAMQFVETIAGSLLASVMKERLHQAERAQLNFAAAASHELRTPLHQINAAASLLRSSLHGVLGLATDSLHRQNAAVSMEDRIEALAQLEIIEANGLSLGNILENIIDTLDIGRLASKVDTAIVDPSGPLASGLLKPPPTAEKIDFADVLEDVVAEAMTMEAKSRRIASGKGLEEVEVILEVLPRNRGGWVVAADPGPLSRALGKLVHNAVKFTDKGHVHITVQDVSRDVVLPSGYDNSIKLSTISIDIKDTGRGMSPGFLDREVLRPFTKEDPFTSGSGLGLGLAQRMIELLGGKLAIASTPGKGTLVHVEIPLHVYSEDHDSDQDQNAPEGSQRGSDELLIRETIRQDGIFLAGFMESKDSSIRRVGKSLLRQLKLHFCRVVPEINYAKLIIMPEKGVSDSKLAELCRLARPGVQVIKLGKDRLQGSHVLGQRLSPKTPTIPAWQGESIPLPNSSNSSADYLHTIPTITLLRPLRPSVMRRIMQPDELPPREPERFVSDVVGGEEARAEHHQGQGDHHIAAVPPSRSDAESPMGSRRRDSTWGTIHPSPPKSTMIQQLNDERPAERPVFNRSPFMSNLSPKSSVATLRQTEPIEDDGTASATTAFSTPANEGDDPLTSQTDDPLSSAPSDISVDSASESGELEKPIFREFRSTSEHTVRGAQMADGQHLKVLVVEDNAVNRKILTTMLRRTSCEFAEAVDGVDAIDQFASFHPDLVLLDITMPRKDGFAAAAEMRHIEASEAAAFVASNDLEDAMSLLAVESRGEPRGEQPLSSSSSSNQPLLHRRRAKIIAVTAMSAEHQRRRGLLECGIDEWRTKPVSMRELKTVVEKLKEEVLGWNFSSDVSEKGSKSTSMSASGSATTSLSGTGTG